MDQWWSVGQPWVCQGFFLRIFSRTRKWKNVEKIFQNFCSRRVHTHACTQAFICRKLDFSSSVSYQTIIFVIFFETQDTGYAVAIEGSPAWVWPKNHCDFNFDQISKKFISKFLQEQMLSSQINIFVHYKTGQNWPKTQYFGFFVSFWPKIWAFVPFSKKKIW